MVNANDNDIDIDSEDWPLSRVDLLMKFGIGHF